MTDVMNDPDCPYRDLKWCIYYEMEGYSNPSVEKIVNDLKYVINNYGDLPYYYKINGKPVVFIYGGRKLCRPVERGGGEAERLH